MTTFVYVAKKGPEEVLKGSISAETRQQAIDMLSRNGLTLISIHKEEKKKCGFFARAHASVRSADLAAFTSQLLDLLAAGVSVYNALLILENQTDNSALRTVLSGVASEVKEGKSFSDALAGYPGVFQSFYVHMVRAGEASGKLESILAQLEETLEKEDDFRRKIVYALAYPSFIIVCGIASVFVILTFIIPRLEGMYEDLGRSLPFLTVCVMSVSTVIQKIWWIVVGVLAVGVVWGAHALKNTKTAETFFDRVLLKIPICKTLLFQEEIVHFMRSLSMLLSSGVTLIEALDISRALLRSRALKEKLSTVSDEVAEGAKLNQALQHKECFSGAIINMVAVGEETGSLDRSLNRIVLSYEKNIEKYIKLITTLIEPILILFIGLFVGVIVISMLLPIFNINLFVR